MTNEMIMNRLQQVIDNSGNDGSYVYEITVNLWEKNGKSRTYFAIETTRTNSRMSKKNEYGYIDNTTGEYVAGKNSVAGDYGYDLGGSRFTYTAEEIVEETEETEEATEYAVEFTTENGSYTGEWECEIVSATSADEAEELMKQHMTDNGVDYGDYVFRVKGV